MMMTTTEVNRARTQSPLGKLPRYFYLAPSLQIKDKRTGVSVRGLFTSKFIPRGKLIGEYRGPKIDMHRTQTKKRFTQYFFSVYADNDQSTVKFVIDGANSRRSSFLRYVNAPNRKLDANTRFEQVDDSILMYATKPIKPDTELLAWYGTHTKHILQQH